MQCGELCQPPLDALTHLDKQLPSICHDVSAPTVVFNRSDPKKKEKHFRAFALLSAGLVINQALVSEESGHPIAYGYLQHKCTTNLSEASPKPFLNL